MKSYSTTQSQFQRQQKKTSPTRKRKRQSSSSQQQQKISPARKRKRQSSLSQQQQKTSPARKTKQQRQSSQQQKTSQRSQCSAEHIFQKYINRSLTSRPTWRDFFKNEVVQCRKTNNEMKNLAKVIHSLIQNTNPSLRSSLYHNMFSAALELKTSTERQRKNYMDYLFYIFRMAGFGPPHNKYPTDEFVSAAMYDSPQEEFQKILAFAENSSAPKDALRSFLNVHYHIYHNATANRLFKNLATFVMFHPDIAPQVFYKNGEKRAFADRLNQYIKDHYGKQQIKLLQGYM